MTVFSQSGQISGIIHDSAEQVPLSFASISLFQESDSIQISGMLADSLGKFELSGIQDGKYYLSVRFLGYETQMISSLQISKGQKMELGIIPLRAGQRLLEEIEITGHKSQTYHQIDRQVYDATQYQQAQGGSATDVIRNLPGVSVNAQGEISVRGSTGFIIMLDGRQVQTDAGTLLNQLPANGIQDIEILTTPSAKYDPDGKAGIINIKTKRGATDGFYLQANILLGLPSIEPYDNAEPARRLGGDITLNYRKGKWDLSAGLDYRRDDVSGLRIGYVNTYANEILTEYPSHGERSFDRYQYSGRFSALFRPHENQQLGLSFYAGDRTQYRTADILYDWQQRSIVPMGIFQGPEAYWKLYEQNGHVLENEELIDTLTYYNENLRVRQGDFLIGAIDYNIKPDTKSELKLSVLYEHTLLGGPTDNASLSWPNIADTLQFQYNTNDNPLDGLRIKADYSRKLGDVTWESGYQYRYLSHPGDFIYLDRDLDNDNWIENPLFTNRIELKRQIHGLYTQFSGRKNKLEYSAGLRMEYMDRQVSLAKPDTTYDYRIFQPFPTLNFKYNFKENLSLRGGYSRRIERTTTFKMTPFPEREHNETLEQGDAELLPEFIHLLELGVVKNMGDNSVFATAYYRHVQNVINRVNSVYNDSILNRIYTNAGNAQAIGLEAGTTFYPGKKIQIYLGGNVYNYQIIGDLFGDEINTSNVIYSINAQAKLSITPTLNMQAAFNYLSERVTAQGVDSRFYNPSLTISKSFMDGKMALSLQWLSIDMGLLESNEQRITTVRNNFFTTTNYIYEVDRIMISLSYKLNQPSKQMKFIKSEFGDKEY